MAFKPGELKSQPFGRGGGMGPKTMSLKTEGRPPPPKGPRGYRVEDRIGVQAPAEVIWDVIYDLERWAEWNPTYPKASGVIRIGVKCDSPPFGSSGPDGKPVGVEVEMAKKIGTITPMYP